MNPKTELSRITVDIPTKDHKRLKAVAALLGKSMRELIIISIEEHLQKVDMPNKKTLKAMKDVADGKNLVKAKDAQDLFKQLDI
jgi:hypothetical protein